MIDRVLAIDPGSSKCGMALVRRNGDEHPELLWRRIVPRAECLAAIGEAERINPFQMIVVGGGTTSRELVQQIRDIRPGMGIMVVNEEETTLQARERYWEHCPRTGWRRLLPASLQVPPEPVDDFVALILAERVLTP